MTIVDLLVMFTIVVVPMIIVLGLISPKLVIFSGDKTRARVLRTFGGLFGVMSVLTVVVAIATKGETSKDSPAPPSSSQIAGTQAQNEKDLWDFSWDEVKPYSYGKCKAVFDSFTLIENCMEMEETAFKKLQGDYGTREGTLPIKRRCMKTFQMFNPTERCVQSEIDAAIRLHKSGLQ